MEARRASVKEALNRDKKEQLRSGPPLRSRGAARAKGKRLREDKLAFACYNV